MNPIALTHASKRLSWLLRHGAGETGLPMDPAGWVPVEAVLRALNIPESSLDQVVRENNKGRLELREGRVRACQGHSTEAMPVTREALEASWTEEPRTDLCWHGTSLAHLDAIDREGLTSQARTHVHLAEETDSKVGKRAGVDVLLAIDPERLRARGLKLYRSPNGVLLVRAVPRDCIVAARAVSRNARAREAEVTTRFGSDPQGQR
ncbi:MAG: RNA 2'-phosphotransferase [Deltaproteobacteria bacterium]|nr:RNA 2'-phosphotransferase [Deltaproteobacteria bacterium]